MLLSMTGFATKTIHLPIGDEMVTVTINLKSLNSRFFEASCKMPHTLAYLENIMVKKFKAALHRGNISCVIHLSSLAPLSGAVHPSLKTVEQYLKSVKEIYGTFGDKYNLGADLGIRDLIQLPYIFEQPDEPVARKTTELLLNKIDLLIKELVKERSKEGTALRKDLEKRIKATKILVAKIEKRFKRAAIERKQHLTKNALSMLKNVSDEAKEHYMQQIYTQLDKTDIHEEVIRIKTHIKNLQSCIIARNQEKGKKIDFVLQELFREVNTIAAKCSDSQLSGFAINLKVELEKSREQAQNIV